MENKKNGLRTGALLRLVMEQHNLSNEDISQIAHVEPDTVARWLNGTNRLKGSQAKLISASMNLPPNYFDYKLPDLLRPEYQYLSDNSVIIKPLSGAQIIVELAPEDVRKLLIFAFDLAQDNARLSSGDDSPEPDVPLEN